VKRAPRGALFICGFFRTGSVARTAEALPERDVFLAGGSGFLGTAARLAVSAVFAAPFVPVFIPAVVPVLAEAGGAVSVAFAPAAFEAALRPGPAAGVLPAGIARRRRMPPA